MRLRIRCRRQPSADAHQSHYESSEGGLAGHLSLDLYVHVAGRPRILHRHGGRNEPRRHRQDDGLLPEAGARAAREPRRRSLERYRAHRDRRQKARGRGRRVQCYGLHRCGARNDAQRALWRARRTDSQSRRTGKATCVARQSGCPEACRGRGCSLDSTAYHQLRTATQDTEIGGKNIREGDWVVVWNNAANRTRRYSRIPIVSTSRAVPIRILASPMDRISAWAPISRGSNFASCSKSCWSTCKISNSSRSRNSRHP